VVELSEKAEQGLDVIGSMMGPAFSGQLREMASSDKFGSTVSRMAAEFAFGTAWADDKLARREKSLVIIGILIALRQASELKNHVKIGVANGLTAADIEGALIQATPYVGFPAIATAGTAVIEALREIGKDPNVKTSEERGML
jgi:4-carboxymuconolactone decarboxylase